MLGWLDRIDDNGFRYEWGEAGCPGRLLSLVLSLLEAFSSFGNGEGSSTCRALFEFLTTERRACGFGVEVQSGRCGKRKHESIYALLFIKVIVVATSISIYHYLSNQCDCNNNPA